MSKRLYFSNKVSKIPKRWGVLRSQRPLNLQFWWPEVAWFG